MRTYRWVALALGVAIAGSSDSQAAWNNVFQATCHSCRSPAVSYYVAPAVTACAPPCPPPCAPTYVQRSYYQPVTTYQQTTYYEPVTTYRTSYYYEPVTSYRYTSFYDPCTGCCQQVAQPVVSYRLRSQCNAVTSYVARCATVPVTTYRQAFYYEAVNPCCPTSTTAQAVETPIPANGGQSPAPPAAATEERLPPTKVPMAEERVTPMPAGGDRAGVPGSFRPAPPAQPRPERVASYSRSGTLQGEIVTSDLLSRRPNARLTFVSKADLNIRQTVRADANGHFVATVPAGQWYLYVEGADGQGDYHSALAVRENESRVVKVVSR